MFQHFEPIFEIWLWREFRHRLSIDRKQTSARSGCTPSAINILHNLTWNSTRQKKKKNWQPERETLQSQTDSNPKWKKVNPHFNAIISLIPIVSFSYKDKQIHSHYTVYTVKSHYIEYLGSTIKFARLKNSLKSILL